MIFRVAEPADWLRAQSANSFASADLAREGFIHCASRAQVPGVVDRYYSGRDGLWLLAIDEALLGDSSVVWENTAAGQDLFPHVYGPIPLAAVIAHAPLAQDAAGAVVWPASW